MAVITFKMPELEIKIEADLKKYFPEDEMTEVNVNTKSMRIILEEAIKKALENKKIRKEIGNFLSNSIFQSVECKTFNFGHLLNHCSFAKALELRI